MRYAQLATTLHLHLHGTAALERRSASDDQSKVMCSQLRIAVGRVGVCVPGTGKDGVALDSRLQPLLPERETLEFIQTITLGSAVEQSVLEQSLAGALVVHRGLDRTMASIVRGDIFQLPGISPFVVKKSWIIVTLVEVLEHGGEDLRKLFREVDPFGRRLEKLSTAYGSEIRRCRENVFVRSEESLFGANANGDDGRG